MYVKQSEREMNHSHRSLHLFLLNKTSLSSCLYFKGISKAAMHQIGWLYSFFQILFIKETRQLYLLTCLKCYLLFVGLSDTYLQNRN